MEASFLVLLQGLLMGPDFLGWTHLCGLCSQLDTGMSSVWEFLHGTCREMAPEHLGASAVPSRW